MKFRSESRALECLFALTDCNKTFFVSLATSSGHKSFFPLIRNTLRNETATLTLKSYLRKRRLLKLFNSENCFRFGITFFSFFFFSFFCQCLCPVFLQTQSHKRAKGSVYWRASWTFELLYNRCVTWHFLVF